MKDNKIAICDSDEEYLIRLQQQLANRSSFPFSVYIFENAEELKKEKNTFEIILCSGEIYTELKNQPSEGILILLQAKPGEQGELQIRKFQSAEMIRRKILEIYYEQSRTDIKREVGKKNTRLIGVYSPLGRDIQTSFSALLGEFLAESASVLYLNFEPFSGLIGLIRRTEENDLTDLVYFLKNSKDKFLFKLESMVADLNGLSYIAPAFSYMDIAAVRAEDWLLLVRNLKECGNYDYVILDLSELVQGLLDVLRECSFVYSLERKDGVACHKMKEYEELLNRKEYQDVISKTKKLEYPIFRTLPSDLENMAYGELAQYVRKIIQEEKNNGSL